jgi:hypothetical protein
VEDVKRTVADALMVLNTSNAIQVIMPIEGSERSESTCESSQVGSLCFGDDLRIEDAEEIARNISSGNSLDTRLAAFKVLLIIKIRNYLRFHVLIYYLMSCGL